MSRYAAYSGLVTGEKCGVAANALTCAPFVDFSQPDDPLTIVFTPVREYLANMEKQGLEANYEMFIEAMNAHLQEGLERLQNTHFSSLKEVKQPLEELIRKTRVKGGVHYIREDFVKLPPLIREIVSTYRTTIGAANRFQPLERPLTDAVIVAGNTHNGVVEQGRVQSIE